MNTRTNKNFNIGTDLRNKQINEILNSDRFFDQKRFDLEKQEYIYVYPDDNTIPPINNPLPTGVSYQFSVNASKFYASLIFFASCINNLAPEDPSEPDINSLKWSDLFEAYGGFKAQIQSFLKIPQSFQANPSMVVEFDKVVDGFDQLISAFNLYSSTYVDLPLRINYQHNFLEIEQFLMNANIQIHNMISHSMNIGDQPTLTSGEDPDYTATTDWSAFGAVDDDEDDDDDDGDDYDGGFGDGGFGDGGFGESKEAGEPDVEEARYEGNMNEEGQPPPPPPQPPQPQLSEEDEQLNQWYNTLHINLDFPLKDIYSIISDLYKNNYSTVGDQEKLIYGRLIDMGENLGRRAKSYVVKVCVEAIRGIHESGSKGPPAKPRALGSYTQQGYEYDRKSIPQLKTGIKELQTEILALRKQQLNSTRYPQRQDKIGKDLNDAQSHLKDLKTLLREAESNVKRFVSADDSGRGDYSLAREQLTDSMNVGEATLSSEMGAMEATDFAQLQQPLDDEDFARMHQEAEEDNSEWLANYKALEDENDQSAFIAQQKRGQQLDEELADATEGENKGQPTLQEQEEKQERELFDYDSHFKDIATEERQKAGRFLQAVFGDDNDFLTRKPLKDWNEINAMGEEEDAAFQRDHYKEYRYAVELEKLRIMNFAQKQILSEMKALNINPKAYQEYIARDPESLSESGEKLESRDYHHNKFRKYESINPHAADQKYLNFLQARTAFQDHDEKADAADAVAAEAAASPPKKPPSPPKTAAASPPKKAAATPENSASTDVLLRARASRESAKLIFDKMTPTPEVGELKDKDSSSWRKASIERNEKKRNTPQSTEITSLKGRTPQKKKPQSPSKAALAADFEEENPAAVSSVPITATEPVDKAPPSKIESLESKLYRAIATGSNQSYAALLRHHATNPQFDVALNAAKARLANEGDSAKVQAHEKKYKPSSIPVFDRSKRPNAKKTD